MPDAHASRLLGAIESLLCARVADGMIDDRHDPNQELMAQGIANLVTPVVRRHAGHRHHRTHGHQRRAAAARSPVAGIVHALTLLAVVLVAAPLAADIPLAALAAILLFVAWNMGEWREFARLRQFTMNYRITPAGHLPAHRGVRRDGRGRGRARAGQPVLHLAGVVASLAVDPVAAAATRGPAGGQALGGIPRIRMRCSSAR
jgi:hypothetical protein